MDASIFWLILAMSLLIVEALTLGIFMLFFGFGAFITGMLLYVVPLSFEAQIIIFLSISIVSTVNFILFLMCIINYICYYITYI